MCSRQRDDGKMDRSSLEPLSISILVNLKLQDYAHNLTQSHKHILIISQSKHESKLTWDGFGQEQEQH